MSALEPIRWADASWPTVDFVGRICVSFVSDADPVSVECLGEYGVAPEQAPELAAAYMLGGASAVWTLLASAQGGGA